MAHDTRLGAEIDANREREQAATEMEQARLAAAALVEEGRAEAARIVAQANVQAAAIHQTAAQQSAELRQQAQNVSQFITDSASDLRLGASRLNELADQFESELAKRRGADQHGGPFETMSDWAARLRHTVVLESLEAQPDGAALNPKFASQEAG